nr:MAG TPA: hypothetical protein [Caudoviricetes sp.]
MYHKNKKINTFALNGRFSALFGQFSPYFTIIILFKIYFKKT